jgi:hypothetical protein
VVVAVWVTEVGVEAALALAGPAATAVTSAATATTPVSKDLMLLTVLQLVVVVRQDTQKQGTPAPMGRKMLIHRKCEACDRLVAVGQ